MINYKKSVWSTNTRLSAEALNNIESGIELCAKAINTLENKINALSNIAISEQIQDSINVHNISGTAHATLFALTNTSSNITSEIEELKKQIITLKTANTKLSNRVKELESKHDSE